MRHPPIDVPTFTIQEIELVSRFGRRSLVRPVAPVAEYPDAGGAVPPDCDDIPAVECERGLFQKREFREAKIGISGENTAGLFVRPCPDDVRIAFQKRRRGVCGSAWDTAEQIDPAAYRSDREPV